MRTIIRILFAAFVLSLVPTSYVCAQNPIETPAERQARQKRETAAKKKREQEAAARRQREEDARKKREAEEAARRQREAEERERQRVLRELESNMVYVEGGTFMMGATKEQETDVIFGDEEPHQVTLSSFHICKYEVTQELWQVIMGSNPSMLKGSKLPVERVSWEDCQRFITKLNQLTGKKYRLPTEAEWEYAARGGKRSNFYRYAGGNNIDDVAWYKDNSNDHTHEVGTKRANELGLYDMSGNVWEWVQDWKANYSTSSQTNPLGPSSGSGRVRRGGCFCFSKDLCRIARRDSFGPMHVDAAIGLRLVF